jgi:phosphosulfolactate synthase
VTDSYFSACAEVGYRYVEVSDNAIPLERRDKDGLISKARDLGFVVIGEAGSKYATTAPGVLVEDVRACLDAGCWKVFLEAAELFEAGRLRHEVLARVAAEIDGSDVIWELPGAWIPGTHAHEVHALAVWLIEHLGVDVNIANVAPEALLSLEALRRGIGVRTLMNESAAASAGNPAQ